ncbi:MAG: hypothetical protein ACM3SQ_11300 [Betaproteobacteria bacterium]
MRRLVGSGVLALAAALAAVAAPGAARPPAAAPAVLERFWALPDPPPESYRALRHLDAHNDRFDSDAWMDVWTDLDQSGGFHYTIVTEGGSHYIRNHVFRGTLERERHEWASGTPDRASLTPDNYEFAPAMLEADGLESLAVKPRRHDLLLITGAIFLRPDGELVRVEGQLSKNPSFWTRHVHIVRRYGRFEGVRLPVALETTADVVLAGHSTFRMTYEYASVNGRHLADPQPRVATSR